MSEIFKATPRVEAGATRLADAVILLIDDDENLLEVLAGWFTLHCRAVHTAASGTEALVVARQHPLDLVLTDLKLPGFDGLQLLALLKDHSPSLAVVFLTGEGTMGDAILALREGRAFDFLQKPVRDFKGLNDVLERALAHAGTQAAPPRQVPTQALTEVDPLTNRELEVAMLLAQGLDNRQIAERLVLSEKTVKNHLTRIYEKLRVTNRVQAVMTCQSLSLI